MGIRFLLRILIICSSWSFFLGFIFVGNQGIKAYWNIKKSIKHQKVRVAKLKEKKQKLRCYVDDWKTDKFLTEKLAREELLLGMPGEKVYIVK
ncbi:septum formation initiator family protein [Candidatus Babeliales bacterium]|nr:septum formation initiator family protein [Candidatus Babeliales bacterium]